MAFSENPEGGSLTPEEIKRLVDEADRLSENEQYDEAFKLDKRAADAGDARAMTHIGWYYETGSGVSYNPMAAFGWYAKAASLNFAPGQYCLGMCYEEGIGTGIDLDKAIGCYRLAAAGGLDDAAEALRRLGAELTAPKETPQYTPLQLQRIADEARSYYVQELFAKAIEQAVIVANAENAELNDRSIAQHVLGMSMLRTGADSGEAERWLQSAADYGYIPAVIDLATIYKEGTLLTKDHVLAARLYEKAVKAGHKPACFYLGQCYEFGEGVNADIDTAFSLYNEGAAADDPAAQYAVGMCWMTGSGTSEDYPTAEDYFLLAAAQGYTEAEEALRTLEMLRHPAVEEKPAKEKPVAKTAATTADTEAAGEEMKQKIARAEQLVAEKKYDEARPLIEECAEVGMARAQALLGDFYYKARGGCPRDTRKALEWYRRGADGGDTDAMMGAAAILDAEDKDDEASAYYEQAAVAGNIQAAYNLGRMYELGHGIEKDITRAFTWYLTAAEGGDTLSMRLVAIMYENGNGTTADPAAALEWYSKAAKNGDFAAKKAVKRLQEEGVRASGTPKKDTPVVGAAQGSALSEQEIAHLITQAKNLADEDDLAGSFRIHRRLADAGVARGLNSLGCDYVYGKSVDVDLAKGIGLLRRAAEMGEPHAMANLGDLYLLGKGVETDGKTALNWYRQSADKGYGPACFMIGLMYCDGESGIEQNYSEAKKWFDKAIELGDGEAYDGLGMLTDNGYLTGSLNAADYYFRGACCGSDDGAEFLAQCYLDGNGRKADREMALRYFRIAYLLNQEKGIDKIKEHFGNIDPEPTEDEVLEASRKASSLYPDNMTAALEEALLPAAAGDPYASEIVALCLTFGDFKNDKRATEMYLVAARAGLSASQQNVGVRYQKGIGIDADPVEALMWFKKSADQDNVNAMINYAYAMSNGLGTAPDQKVAVEWYRRAADKNSGLGTYNLGTMYEDGNGVAVDFNEAMRLYKRALELGYTDAETAIKNLEKRMGSTTESSGQGSFAESKAQAADRLYSKGSYAEAFEMAGPLADAGDALAAQVIGLCYEFGRGTSENMAKAVHYYQIAVKGNQPLAALNLGVAYEFGKGGLPVDKHRATEFYRMAADAGNDIAQCNLGYCYESGTGVPRDMSVAARWYKKAADQNNGRAQAYLADCYLTGEGARKDPSAAIDLYHKAANGGNTYARRRLGFCYEYSIGVKGNIEESLRWYKKAAENGDDYSKRHIENIAESRKSGVSDDLIAEGRQGYNAYDNRDFAEAFRLARRAADAGEPFAAEIMAFCYNFGNGTTKDEAKAVRYYQTAIRAARPVSMLNLGISYEYGQGGLSTDKRRAAELYRQAADLGNAHAQCNLGYCYEYGIGVAADARKAFEWYTTSAKQGWARAQLNLGLCYEFGKGVDKDVRRAVEYYRLAAEQGNATAQCNLGYCYEAGIGVDKSYDRAVEWYRKSADQGWPRACGCLGKCYEEGWGVRQDYNKAIELLRKGADGGNAYSMAELGYLYETGRGVSKNISTAIEWYRKAAELGNDYAQKRLKALK